MTMKRMMLAWAMILCMVLPLCAAVSAEPVQSPENTANALTSETLVGLWELDHVNYGGKTTSADEWISFFGELATMEFISDGTWVMKSGGMTEIYFYEFVDGELFAEGGKAPLSLDDGQQLVFDTGNGMVMVFTKSAKPGLAGTVSVDEALLGTWVFDQLIYLPDEVRVEADMFPMIFGTPAPTLEVVNVGFAVVQLSNGKRAYPVDELHLEDGKLVFTEEYDNGKSTVWSFVREGAKTKEAEITNQGTQSETAEAVSTDGTMPAETGERFSYNGAAWGMSREEVRALVPAAPIEAPTAATGHTALVYQYNRENGFSIVQYNFLPSDALYNISIIAPDDDGTFYAEQRETWTALYGESLTEAGADLHSDDDPVAVMMAALMQNSGDSNLLGWQADDETVIIVSTDPTHTVCFVEIRRYTDYFRFE